MKDVDKWSIVGDVLRRNDSDFQGCPFAPNSAEDDSAHCGTWCPHFTVWEEELDKNVIVRYADITCSGVVVRRELQS